MRRAFNYKGSKKLDQLLTDPRKRRKQPSWIPNQAWRDMCKYWDSPEYAKSIQAKNNRSSRTGGLVHRCGSISMGTHALNMRAESGCVPSPIEVFKRTHLKNNIWVDDRSKKTAEAYMKLMESEPHPDPKNDQDVRKKQIDKWVEAVGGRNKKGRTYGMPYHNWCSTSFGVPPQMPTHEQEAHQQKTDAKLEKLEQLLTQQAQQQQQSQQMHEMRQQIMMQSQQMQHMQQVMVQLLQNLQPRSLYQQFPQSFQAFSGVGGACDGSGENDDEDGEENGDDDDIDIDDNFDN